MERRRLLGSTTLSGRGQFSSQPTEQPHSVSARNAQNHATQISIEKSAFEFNMDAQERGVIISNPMKIKGSEVKIESIGIDPLELRRSLLFWDKIVWPATSGIYIDGGPDIEFLISEGKILRPYFGVNGDAATALSMAFFQTYQSLEGNYPGQWILSNADQSLTVHGKDIVRGRGIMAKLMNAVPIPDRTMPLEDVILFREKRGDEVVALRSAIEEFYQQWVNSEDKDHQLKLALARIDSASAEMLKIARESRFPFSMSSWRVNFNASPDAMKAMAGYLAASSTFDLNAIGSLLAGAASSLLSIGTGVGFRNSTTQSPFNYVASMEKDPF